MKSVSEERHANLTGMVSPFIPAFPRQHKAKEGGLKREVRRGMESPAGGRDFIVGLQLTDASRALSNFP